MIYLTYFVLLIIGVLLGVAINALADDLPHHRWPGRPHCHMCSFPNHPRQWVTNVALLTGRGRCAQCRARLSWRKPLVEIVSAIILIFLYQRFGPTLKYALLALFLECLFLITVIDMEHRLILFSTIFPAAGVALLYGLFGGNSEFWPALGRTLLGGVVGFGVFYLFYLLGFVYSAWVARRRGQPLDEIAFGGGDANLGGVVGLAVGWPGILLTLFYAVMAGGVIAGLVVLVWFLRRRNAMLTPIPYGPFIVLGAVVVLVFAAELKRFYSPAP